MRLPKYFKSILWFADFNKISLQKDCDVILFQAFEKGRLEHFRYLVDKLGKKTLFDFARKNRGRFSRKSIFPFAKLMFS